jgi:hypothetical protein
VKAELLLMRCHTSPRRYSSLPVRSERRGRGGRRARRASLVREGEEEQASDRG